MFMVLCASLIPTKQPLYIALDAKDIDLVDWKGDIALASSKDLTSELKLTTASAIASCVLLGTYEDNRFEFESKKLSLKSIDFLNLGGGLELEKKSSIERMFVQG
ncbi:hypothetical protein L2E82_10456 [Cichorium intybus]|uniref:Uncharacterized protein n=1 Tax=Cichorium intybus TaxID=13427 RepID=A0ACB9GBL9_CICIN|nr:hypothetical protein L2E82_10456 [Cichorium intybus]